MWARLFLISQCLTSILSLPFYISPLLSLPPPPLSSLSLSESVQGKMEVQAGVQPPEAAPTPPASPPGPGRQSGAEDSQAESSARPVAASHSKDTQTTSLRDDRKVSLAFSHLVCRSVCDVCVCLSTSILVYRCVHVCEREAKRQCAVCKFLCVRGMVVLWMCIMHVQDCVCGCMCVCVCDGFCGCAWDVCTGVCVEQLGLDCLV